MKEIPMPYVKANQAGIVLFVIVATILQMPEILAVLWVIQVSTLVFGVNLFAQIAKPFLKVNGAVTQSRELQRFNNVLAVIFLTLSLFSFGIHFTVGGYIFSTMLFLASSAALLGYCVGCTIYFQYKQFRALQKR